MSHIDPQVPAHEHGVLRLFLLDTDTSTGRTLRDAIESGGPVADRAAAKALGVDRIESKWLGLAATRDLEELGIEAYLRQGYDVPPDQIAPVLARLEAANGQILIVPSRAFAGAKVTLSPSDLLHPLAEFTLDESVPPAEPMNPADPADLPEPPEPPHETKGAGPRPVALFGALLAAAVAIGLVVRYLF